MSKEDAVEIAVRDAAERAGVPVSEVSVDSARDASFPNGALGAPREGEMSFDMITSGWAILLTAGGRSFEYRADSRQVRLVGFGGRNHLVYPV